MELERICRNFFSGSLKENFDDVLETAILKELSGPILLKSMAFSVGWHVADFWKYSLVEFLTLVLEANKVDSVGQIFRVLHQRLDDLMLVRLMVNTA